MPDDADPLLGATDALFGLDPGEFVAARNDLVKALRASGDRSLATRVAELRRPSPAAWAVNQLARRRGDDLQGLVRLGQALREAQEQALGGADAELLRQAARARRDAVAGLADAAVVFLAERAGGGGEAHAGEIVATLEAASLDAHAGEAALVGRLVTALEPPSGFGDNDLPASAPAPRPSPGSSPDADAAFDNRSDAGRAERLSKAERAVAEATELAARKAAEASGAAAAVAEREAALAAAEAEVARLEGDVEDARRRARAAARPLAEARAAAADAQGVADDARQRVSDARARVEALRR